MDEDAVRDENAMDIDWSATRPSPGRDRFTSHEKDDGSWLRPQRFFAPERPTGLEGLLEKTELVDEPERRTFNPLTGVTAHKWNWGWVYAGSLIPLIGVAYKAWRWKVAEVQSNPI